MARHAQPALSETSNVISKDAGKYARQVRLIEATRADTYTQEDQRATLMPLFFCRSGSSYAVTIPL